MKPEDSELLIKAAALLLVGFALYQARKNSEAVLQTISHVANAIPGKRVLLKQAQWDFNILFITTVFLISGILQLLEKQTLVTFLTAVLAALGVKSVSELKHPDTARQGGHAAGDAGEVGHGH